MLINIKVFIFVAEMSSVLIQLNLVNIVLWNAGKLSTQTPFVLKGAFRNIKNNFRAGPGCALIQTLILQTPSCFSVLHDEDSD